MVRGREYAYWCTEATGRKVGGRRSSGGRAVCEVPPRKTSAADRRSGPLRPPAAGPQRGPAASFRWLRDAAPYVWRPASVTRMARGDGQTTLTPAEVARRA